MIVSRNLRKSHSPIWTFFQLPDFAWNDIQPDEVKRSGIASFLLLKRANQNGLAEGSGLLLDVKKFNGGFEGASRARFVNAQ